MKKAVLIGALAVIALGMRSAMRDDNTTGAKWDRLHPEVKRRALFVLDEAQKAFADSPYTLHFFDGWRDLGEQQNYISGGTSFISNPRHSYHVWGLAVDFVFKDENGKWTWEPGKDCAFWDFTCKGSRWYWDTLGQIIERAGFEWGGRWKTFDGPHAQLTQFGTATQLAARYNSPDNFTGNFA